MRDSRDKVIDWFEMLRGGASQSEVAETAGISIGTLSGVLNKRVRISENTAKKLAVAMGCDWKDLFQSKQLYRLIELRRERERADQLALST